MRESESIGQSFSFCTWNLPIIVQQKPIFKIQKKFNMAAVKAIIIDNLQLKYRKVCASRNLLGRCFSFSTWNLPIMVQIKPIFQIFQKSNMAAVMVIIIDNLQFKYRNVCTVQNLWAGSVHFHCACYPYFRKQKLIFKICFKFNITAITGDNYR